MSERTNRIFQWIQGLTLVITLAIGGTIIVVFLLSSAASTRRTQESDRVRFDMVKAQTCALVGVITLPTENRDQETVQQIVDNCLALVDLEHENFPVATTGE